MSFDWHVSFGQLIVSVPVFWVIVMLARIYQMMLNFRIEHEYLMHDWCARQNPPLKLMDIPTRRTRWW